MINLKMILTGVGAIMILVGFAYVLILRKGGQAYNRQRWTASALVLGGIALIYAASRMQ